MKNITTKKIALNGLMVALVFLATRFTTIPIMVGYFNLGDAVIMITAILLGRNSGFFAGAVGSAIADVVSGYGMFAPITFLVKGIEGYVVGTIASYKKGKRPTESLRIVAIVIGAAIMIAGYFIAESTVLVLFDKTNTFGYTYAIKELVSANIPQGAASSLLAYALSSVLIRTNIHKHIAE